MKSPVSLKIGVSSKIDVSSRIGAFSLCFLLTACGGAAGGGATSNSASLSAASLNNSSLLSRSSNQMSVVATTSASSSSPALSSQSTSSVSNNPSSTNSSSSVSNLASSVSTSSAASVASSSAASASSMTWSSAVTVNLHPARVTPVGVNLENLTDYSKSDVFVDLVKQSRGFGKPDLPHVLLNSTSFDSNGWPTKDFGIFFFTSRNAGQMAGTYRLIFSGKFQSLHSQGTNALVQNIVYNATTNTTTADVVVGQTQTQLTLGFVGTQRDANAALGSGTGRVQLLHPGYTATSPEIFMPNYLENIKPFQVVRYNTLTDSKGQPVSWATRTTSSWPIQSIFSGRNESFSWEYAIAIANATQTDMWINIPVLADDNYVNQLALLIQSSLNSNLNVYVEYDNEIWNSIFTQYTANRNATINESYVLDGQGNPVSTTASNLNTRIKNCPEYEPDLNLTLMNAGTSVYTDTVRSNRRVARRIKEISDLFANVFGSSAINTKIRPVLAYQASNPAYMEAGLCFLMSQYGSPSNYIYAIAGAPYHGLGSLATSDTLTVDQVITGLYQELPKVRKLAQYEKATSLAAFYGLKFMSYEGGSDTDYAHSMANKTLSAKDARMQQITKEYLNDFHAFGGDILLYFDLNSDYNNTTFPVYGLMDSQDNPDMPKYRGVMEVIANTKAPVSAGFAVPVDVDGYAYVGNSSKTGPLDISRGYIANGAFKEYLVRTSSAGNYSLILNLGHQNGSNTSLKIAVNNGAGTNISVAPTAAGTYVDQAPMTVHLNAGLNVIRLTMPSSMVNVGKLKIQ